MKKTLKNVRNVVIAAVVASLAGFGASSAAIAVATDAPEPPRFEVNASGQTYGPGTGEVDPDLILAQGTNGAIGYVLRVDLVGPEMRNPEEVAAWLEAFPQDQPRDIPLYESDGRTVIGTFAIGAADVTEYPVDE